MADGIIITQNLEGEFRRLRGKTKEEIERELKRKISAGIVTRAQTRVVEPFYIPYISRTTIEIPTDWKQLNKLKRYFFYNEPIVAAACELHAEFPLSTFDLTHEDANLANEFNEIAEDLNLFEFLLDMLLEYWVIGESFIFGFLDSKDNPRCWTKFIMINPDYVHIQKVIPSPEKEDYVILLEPDDMVKKIVNNGPNHPETGYLYDLVPDAFKEAVRTNKKIKLPAHQVFHFKRPGNYFSARGVSVIERCMKWLFYRDKLREAQYAIADRHITPKEFYLIGSDAHPATPEQIEAFRQALLASYNEPNQAIIWHHALNIRWEGASGRTLPIQPELQYIDKQLAIALLINEGIITAERQPYASTSVALDVMIQRYIALRSRIVELIRKFVFGTICLLNDIYKPHQFELKYRIRVDKRAKLLWLPDVKWTKGSLRDELGKLNFLLTLFDRDLLPPDYIYAMLDYNKEEVEKKLAEWRAKVGKEKEQKGVPTGLPALIPELPVFEEPAGGELGAGAEELPELPTEEESRAVPPESHEEVGLPVGI
jgi:hypothetical protein